MSKKNIINGTIPVLFFHKIILHLKIITMRLDKGKPSGINKSEGTGVPSKVKHDMKKDDELTRRHTDEDVRARTRKPNRNTDKGDPTNAGGYRGGS